MSPASPQLHIAAVVLHDGGGMEPAQRNDLGRPLNLAAALESQTRPPDTVIDLSRDTYQGPEDLSRALRSRLLPGRGHAAQAVTTGPHGVQNSALWRTVERQLGDGFSPRYQWLWILPEGAIPAADALERLEDRIFTVTDEKTHHLVDIVGAKQLQAHTAERRLINVGLFPGSSGELFTGTEPSELDQGQYDGHDAVPAVSAHGMLVRARVFGDLGGFDPALPGDYAAAQFCERAREAGSLTLVEPQAVVLRHDPPAREVVHRWGGALWLPADQRRGQMRTRLSGAPALAAPVIWLSQWVVLCWRLLALMVCKAPDLGLSQAAVMLRTLLDVPTVIRMRRFRAAGLRAARTRESRNRDGSADDALVAPRVSPGQIKTWRRRDVTAETVVTTGGRSSAGSSQAAPGVRGDHELVPARAKEDRIGLFLVLTVLTGVSLVGFRELLTSTALTGGAAIPASSSIGDAWYHTVSFLAPETLGERSAADPFSLVILLISVLTAGHASAVLLWMVILAAPLSALTAWWVAGFWGHRALPRGIAALLWALLPALHSSVGQGRVGAVLAHILLPLVLGLTVKALRARTARADGEPRQRVAALRLASGWETAAAASLILALVTAAAPVLLVPAVIICAAAPLLLGRVGRTLWLIPIPALVLAAPMIISAWDRGSNLSAVLISAPGAAVPAEDGGANAHLWQQLLGFSQAFTASSGLPGAFATEAAAWLPDVLAGNFWSLRLALIIGGPLLGVALLAFFAAARRPAVTGAGLVLVGTLAWSALTGALTASHAGGELLPAASGPLVSLMALCLIVAAMNVFDMSRQADTSLGGLFAPVASTLLVLSIFVGGVFWAAPRMLPDAQLQDQPITAVNAQQALISGGTPVTLPATAADQGSGPAGTRTLVMSSTPAGVNAHLVSGSGAVLDSARSASSAHGLPRWAGQAPWPLTSPDLQSFEIRPAEQRLGELVAAIAASGSTAVPEIMHELGIGHVLVTRGESLREAANTSAGLVMVADTAFGTLWRVETDDAELPTSPGISGTSGAWARIVTEDGETVALVASQRRSVETDLHQVRSPEGEPLVLDDSVQHYLEIASERAAGWRATLNGENLRTVTASTLDVAQEDMPWMRQFYLPADALDASAAELHLTHRSDLQAPVLITVAAVLLLFLIIAVPLPRTWRLREVRP